MQEALSSRSALVGLRCDEDLQRRAVLADDSHAIPRQTRAQCRREPICPLVAHSDLQHAVAVVLGPQLPHPAHLAKRELEAVPVIGCRQRCDHEVGLSRSRRRPRRRDRRLRRRGLFDHRFLNHRALFAILAGGDEARLGRRRDRRIVPRGRALGGRRRRGLRGCLLSRLARADARREIDDVVALLLLLLVVLVVFRHLYPSSPATACSIDCARRTSKRSSMRSSVSSAAPMLGCPTTSSTFGRVMREFCLSLASSYTL